MIFRHIQATVSCFNFHQVGIWSWFCINIRDFFKKIFLGGSNFSKYVQNSPKSPKFLPAKVSLLKVFASVSKKDIRYWSHGSTATNDGTQAKHFWQSLQKHCSRKKREEKKDSCKAFCVTRKHNKNGNCKAFCFTCKRKGRNIYFTKLYVSEFEWIILHWLADCP